MKNRPATHHNAAPPEDTLPLLDDDLPSYDSAILPSASSSAHASRSVQYYSTINPNAGGSSGIGSSANTNGNANANANARPIPGYLLSPPPNAEPLMQEYARLEGVDVKGSKRGKGMWVSDARLHDPALLYDWLRLQAAQPPQVRVKCFGSHKEHRHQHGSDKKDEVTVVDFDFYIDLGTILDQDTNASTTLVPIPPQIPTFRGTHTYSYGGYGPTAGRGCSAREKQVFKREWALKAGLGMPIWDMHPEGPLADAQSPDHQHGRAFFERYADEEAAITRTGGASREHGSGTAGSGSVAGTVSTGTAGAGAREGGATLLEWCQAYCAAPGAMKELVLRKQLYGWDLVALERAIRQTIASTGYDSANAAVSIDVEMDEIHVCPRNWYSRIKSSTAAFAVLCFIGCLTLVAPVIFILRELGIGASNRWIGGGSWKVAYATYALKRYPPLPGTYANERVEQARERIPGMLKMHPYVPRTAAKGLVRGPRGVHYLQGRKEGEWFREWEERVRMGVQMQHKGELRGTIRGERDVPSLDGYEE